MNKQLQIRILKKQKTYLEDNYSSLSKGLRSSFEQWIWDRLDKVENEIKNIDRQLKELESK